MEIYQVCSGQSEEIRLTEEGGLECQRKALRRYPVDSLELFSYKIHLIDSRAGTQRDTFRRDTATDKCHTSDRRSDDCVSQGLVVGSMSAKNTGLLRTSLSLKLDSFHCAQIEQENNARVKKGPRCATPGPTSAIHLIVRRFPRRVEILPNTLATGQPPAALMTCIPQGLQIYPELCRKLVNYFQKFFKKSQGKFIVSLTLNT